MADEQQPPADVDDDDDVRWGMGDALFGLALTLVVPAIVGGTAFALAGWDDADDIPLTAVALLQVPLWAGLLGAPLWATSRKGRRSLATDFGLRQRWTDIPLGLVVGLATQLVLGLVIQALYRVLDVDVDRIGESAEELSDRATDPVGVVLLVLVVVVAAPLFEELFYRGLWLRAVEKRWGTTAGVVVSSLVFASVHFQAYDFVPLIGFAVVVAVLTARTGRLGPAIWAHVAFNLTTVVVLLA